MNNWSQRRTTPNLVVPGPAVWDLQRVAVGFERADTLFQLDDVRRRSQIGFPAVALALLTLTHGDRTALQSIATIGLIVFLVVAGGFALATLRLVETGKGCSRGETFVG